MIPGFDTKRRRLRAAASLCAGLVFLTGAVLDCRDILRAEASTLETAVVDQADRLGDHLGEMARALGAFTPADIVAWNGGAVSARIRTLDAVLAPGRNVFLARVDGALLTDAGPASAPSSSWLQEALAAPRGSPSWVGQCTRNPIGPAWGSVLSRRLVQGGTLVGAVGSFIPASALQSMEDDLAAGDQPLDAMLVRRDGTRIGCGAAAGGGTAFARRIPAALRLAFAYPVGAFGIQLIGQADLRDRLDAGDILGIAGCLACGIGLVAVGVFGLAGTRRQTPPPGAAAPEQDTTAWVWETDAARQLVGVAGNAPKHLMVPRRRRLDDVAGPIPDDDRRWNDVLDAMQQRRAFSGLQVPLAVPGRDWMLSIYEIEGQPVVDTGGFWGTARLMREELRLTRPDAVATEALVLL